MTLSTSDQIAAARELLREAKSIVALTGAGISTGAGIPDYRGPEGVWTKNPEAEKVSNLSDYLNNPRVRALAWQRRADSPIWSAQPTPAHRALVDLEDQGRLGGIITQNVDGLHLRAGSNPELVHEMHGNVRTWRCEDCAATGPMAPLVQQVNDGETDPRCPNCGGIIRATVILFGEALDPDVIDAALSAITTCDALLAVGTTLTVYPVAGFVPMAVRRGVPMLIANAQPTPFDQHAAAVLRDDVQQVLPKLLASPST